MNHVNFRDLVTSPQSPKDQTLLLISASDFPDEAVDVFLLRAHYHRLLHQKDVLFCPPPCSYDPSILIVLVRSY